MSAENKKSFITDLWERRVPQFFATYVGICWGILQFLKFASERYGLNDYWIDKFLIFALILIPTVAIFTYNHGRPGRDGWKGYEKILVPINFIVAFVFAGLFGSGSGVQASAAQEVEITTEEVDTVTRVIPSLNSTKSFAVFPFKNLNPDKKDNWLRLSYPLLFEYDMAQDMRTYFIEKDNIKFGYDSQQVKFEDDATLSSMIKIAKDNIADFLVTGSFNTDSNNPTLEIIIYDTKTGEEFFKNNYEGSDIYSAIDKATKEAKSNLFLEESSNFDPGIDLPCADLFTSNPEALKHYTTAHYNYHQGKEFDEISSNIEKAFQLDSTSAEIIAIKAAMINIGGDLTGGAQYYKKALKHDETLPERQKFEIRSTYYRFNQELDKYFKVLENWKTLYPNDYKPYKTLIGFKRALQESDKAKQIALDAKANGHNSRVLRTLADICIERGELDEAEKYLEEYFQTFPDKRKNDRRLAEIYVERGQYDKALQFYENIELLNPNDHRIKINISEALLKQGEFESAISKLNSELPALEILEDSLSFFAELQKIYALQGRSDAYVAIGDQKLETLSNRYPPNIVGSILFRDVGNYYILGKGDHLKQIADNLFEKSPQMQGIISCLTNVLEGIILENLEKIKTHYQGMCKQSISQGTQIDLMYQGIIAGLEGDHDKAIEQLETFIDSSGSKEMGTVILSTYTKAGMPEKTITTATDYLKTDPYNGMTLYELSKAYLAKGEVEMAKETYKKIKSKIWNNMDPGFIYYKRMEDLEKELGLNG